MSSASFGQRARLRSLAIAGAVTAWLTCVATPAEAHTSGTHAAGTMTVDAALAATRAVDYVALFVLVGGGAFLALIWSKGADVFRARIVLWTAWAAGVLATVMGIGLRAAQADVHPSVADALDPALFMQQLDSAFGRAWAAKGLVLLLAIPLLRAMDLHGRRAVASMWWRVGGAAVGVAAIRAVALAGHAQSGRAAWAGSIAIFVHLLGLALWLGGLAFLATCVLPRRQGDELSEIVPRFSMMAMLSVTGIVGAGAFLLWQQVGSPGALFSTGYGRLLLLKFGIFGLIMAAAQRSRRWVQNRLEVAVARGGSLAAVRPFVVSVGSETALAIGALVVMGIVVGLTPPV
jgi:putative copper export protein